MPTDLTVIIVRTEGRLYRRTLTALLEQSLPVAAVVVTTQAGLAESLRDVRTEWVSVLSEGVEPSPGWSERLCAEMGDASLGCLGGRILVVDQAATFADWIPEGEGIARIDLLGRPRTRFTDIPSADLRADVLVLPRDCMIARTALVAERVERAGGYGSGTDEVLTCLLGVRRGLRAVYDSRLVVTRPMHGASTRAPDPGDWEADGLRDMMSARWYPAGAGRIWRVSFTLLLGTRRSPGLMQWPAYSAWPRRLGRWKAYMRGKRHALMRH